jgi:hypothetical protein
MLIYAKDASAGQCFRERHPSSQVSLEPNQSRMPMCGELRSVPRVGRRQAREWGLAFCFCWRREGYLSEFLNGPIAGKL